MMLRFKPRISGFRSNTSTNLARTTDPGPEDYLLIRKRPSNNSYQVQQLVSPLVVDVGQLVGRDLEGQDHGREASGSTRRVQLQKWSKI